ncbi:unnamed protein product [Darwinula stevensoni]|uniref:N-acetyltransferase ESCO2 n=1 Tax=Darwinula stevensoni TaxID=69355 RepID=A0A7R8XDG3_9CRUS|nr:unnamed protein product [Darwinula stevensoni]CAG0893466.1 unnamed protein product [Darwinula stevensoni]
MHGQMAALSRKRKGSDDINKQVWHGVKRPKLNKPKLHPKSEKQDDKSKAAGKLSHKTKSLTPSMKSYSMTFPTSLGKSATPLTPTRPKKFFVRNKRSPRKATMKFNGNIKVEYSSKKESAEASKTPTPKKKMEVSSTSSPSTAVRRSPRKLSESAAISAARLLNQSHESSMSKVTPTGRLPSPVKPSKSTSSSAHARKKLFQPMSTVANTSIFDFDEMDGVDKTVDTQAMALSEVDLNKSPDPHLKISNPTPSTSPESHKFFSVFYKRAGKTPSSPGQKRDSSPKVYIRKKLLGDADQMQIDVGQRSLAPKTCETCGMFYGSNDADELTHAKFHGQHVAKLKYKTWKKERCLTSYLDGKVIAIHPGDASHCWKKVDAVLELVDAELGFSHVGIRNPKNTKVYFYVRDGSIIGCLVAESIKTAFRVEDSEIENSKDAQTATSRSICCSQIPTAAICGISRIWVSPAHRRNKFASNLLESMRLDFVYPHILSIDEIAFSDPTVDGLIFARKYTGKNDFLVYNR